MDELTNRPIRHRTVVVQHDGIVAPDRLRHLSGKKTDGGVRRWARANGIKVGHGADGPWTTVAALNEALKVTTAKEDPYNPRDLL